MKQKHIGHFRNGLNETRKRSAAIEEKRMQVAGVQALLETHEAMEDRDHDYELHLRAKLRQKKNELQAMGI